MRLLGGFALEFNDVPVNITSQRMQALLAYLALHRVDPQPRQRLAFLLWPDSSESQAHTNLRTLLHRLHTTLEDADQLITVDSQAISWQSTAALSLDVDEFERAIDEANTAEPSDSEDAICMALERAVACYPGDLLPDCYDEWVLLERERLHQTLFTALERLVMILEQRRRYSEALSYARRLVSLDSLNEVAALTLMRLYTLNGDRASALRVYHATASTLQTELGGRPGAALSEAYEQLLAAEAVSPISPLSEKAAAPLIARDREWKRMQAIWHIAVSGQPRLLILSGEAGIGKTRLAEDFLTWAGRQGIITAAARCYAAEGDLAYAPVTALLRSEVLRPGILRLSSEWFAEIGRIMPELMQTRPDVQQRGTVAERWQRQRLFEALAHAVLAVKRPLLLLFDDLQWCDRDTLEWLHFLLRYDPTARLLVVGTVRVEEVAADHALIHLLEAVRREGRSAEIELSLLSQDATTELAQHLEGRALTAEQVENLYRETEGNPLFVVEMLRSELKFTRGDEQKKLDASADSGESPLGLPPRVQAVVTHRLSLLSPAARTILDVAAVIGRSFTFGVLSKAADLDEDAVVRGIDELWQRRIVREQGADAYDFTHGKLRAVAYAGLSLARRRVLHRRVADALEREYVSALDTVSGQIAIHYEQARRVEQAVAYYWRAAAYARHLYANDAAIAHYRHALTLLGDQAQPGTTELYEQLGDVLHFVGHYPDAREAWQQALDAIPERERVKRAHLQRKLGNAWRDQYQYEDAQRAYDDAEATLGSVQEEDEDAVWFCWGQIQLERINVLYWRGQVHQMLTLIDQLRALFEQRSSIMQRARLHQISAIALLRATRYSYSPEAVEHNRVFIRLLAEAGEVGMVPAAHFQLGFSMLWALDDLSEAEQEITTALTLAIQSGDISLEGRCLTYLTFIARMQGRMAETRDYAERSLRVATTGNMHDYIGAAHGSLAWLEWCAGDLVAARKQGELALEAWNRLPAPYMFEWIGRLPLLAIALAENDLTDALGHARVLLDEVQKRLPSPVESALFAALRAADGENREECLGLLQQSIESAQQHHFL